MNSDETGNGNFGFSFPAQNCIRAKNIEWRLQCDQKKIAKCLQKLPKNDFTRKMIDLTPLQKMPKNVGDFGKLLLPKALKSCPKSNKSPNLVTLMEKHEF